MSDLMEKSYDLTVTVRDDGIRPGGKRGKCTYCGRPIGEKHLTTCVCVHKAVRLRAIFDVGSAEYEEVVPFHWGTHDVEFFYNEGTWCAGNLDGRDGEVGRLARQTQEVAGLDCICDRVTVKYVETVDDRPFVYLISEAEVASRNEARKENESR